MSVWWPDRLGLARTADGGVDDDGFWNAATFAGRRLALADVPAGSDPTEAARRFFLETRARLDALPVVSPRS